ncbi:hypothetical protein [Pseudorhodoferax sp. Leaf267]|nr:hypothetical protein [Pseudorhodoferax sp. Leaf267]
MLAPIEYFRDVAKVGIKTDLLQAAEPLNNTSSALWGVDRYLG